MLVSDLLILIHSGFLPLCWPLLQWLGIAQENHDGKVLYVIHLKVLKHRSCLLLAPALLYLCLCLIKLLLFMGCVEVRRQKVG
jgi:hypothetical protein